MKKILLLSAVTLFSLNQAAFADGKKFNGFYVGGELGAGAARFDADQNNPAVGGANVGDFARKAEISGTGILGGLNLGYGMVHAPSHVYFAFNIAANLSSLKGSSEGPVGTRVISFKNEFNIKNSFSADVRLGYAFENALVYALLGVVSSKIEADTKVSNSDPGAAAANRGEYAAGSSSNRKTGLLLGLGIEVPVANRFTIGGEYRYAHYGNVKYDVKVNNAARANATALLGGLNNGDVLSSHKVKPSSHSFVITAKYRF